MQGAHHLEAQQGHDPDDPGDGDRQPEGVLEDEVQEGPVSPEAGHGGRQAQDGEEVVGEVGSKMLTVESSVVEILTVWPGREKRELIFK